MADTAAAAQAPWDIRCEWGPRGLAALAPISDVVVLVDVLSFSTCVEMAVSRGAAVFPFAWRDERAAAFAGEIGAVLAGPRGEGPQSRSSLSLSPLSFRHVAPGTRIVLPSPNGATLSLGAGPGVVLTGCLRNAAAVARAARALGRRIAMIPAGERWPDGSLRPCVEDWLGAGAILDALDAPGGDCSPEAEAARAAFRAIGPALPRVLRDCVSGRELLDRGHGGDVAPAAELNVSDAVPVLRDRAYHLLGPAHSRGG